MSDDPKPLTDRPIGPPRKPGAPMPEGEGGPRCACCEDALGTVRCQGGGYATQWPSEHMSLFRELGHCPHGKHPHQGCMLCIDCIALQEDGCPVDIRKAMMQASGLPESIVDQERRRRGLPVGY